MRLRYRFVSVEYGWPAQAERAQRTGWSRFFPMPYAREGVWRPPTDVYETDTHIVVMMELAGVKEDDIEVTIFNDILVVSGSRQDALRPERVLYHEMGINFGRFRSEVYLPIRVNPDCVDALYENGFLTISLQKSCQP
ncbi:MAG: Hsp20/alpha crystallin family protein [Sphingomonadaceae bacterium]